MEQTVEAHSLSYRRVLLKATLFAGVISAAASASVDDISRVPARGPLGDVKVVTDTEGVVRADLPKTYFGFNIPWENFQYGYMREGRIRPEIVQWLKPFEGAVYRYPGGTVSNWFEWEKSIGPIQQRMAQRSRGDRIDIARFGFDEFIALMRTVKGVPLVVANLYGTKGQPWRTDKIIQSATKWVRYSNTNGAAARQSQGRPEPCRMDAPCVVRWWELGNELDHGEFRWDAGRYIDRARQVGKPLLLSDPRIKLVVPTRTAGWTNRSLAGKNTSEFNRTIASGLSDMASAFSIHPYYDGRAVPAIMTYLEEVLHDLRHARYNGDIELLITEHARWPNKPILGSWQKNWPQTGDLGGAISTSDFLLALASMREVKAAMWHALGARGPWQLFYIDPSEDVVYPNAVYWALRVLRSGWYDKVLTTTVSSPNNSRYRGGYDVRARMLADANGERYSLLAVNRAENDYVISLEVPAFSQKQFVVTHCHLSGEALEERNSSDAMDTLRMQSTVGLVQFDKDGHGSLRLPGYSVSAFLFIPQDRDPLHCE